MKKYILFLCVLILGTGCYSNTQIMTKSGFASIEPGMAVKAVEKQFGKPYAIYSRDGNSDIYEYIERIMMGPEVVEQRRYYLVISNEKVVGKYMKFSMPPAYEAIYSDDSFPNY